MSVENDVRDLLRALNVIFEGEAESTTEVSGAGLVCIEDPVTDLYSCLKLMSELENYIPKIGNANVKSLALPLYDLLAEMLKDTGWRTQHNIGHL